MWKRACTFIGCLIALDLPKVVSLPFDSEAVQNSYRLTVEQANSGTP